MYSFERRGGWGDFECTRSNPLLLPTQQTVYAKPHTYEAPNNIRMHVTVDVVCGYNNVGVRIGKSACMSDGNVENKCHIPLITPFVELPMS